MIADVTVTACAIERAVPDHWEINEFGQQTLIRATPPSITVRFTNSGAQPARDVRFAVVEDRVAATTVDVAGTFAPGVAIVKTIALPDATIVVAPPTCVPLVVTRADGSTWTNPEPPRPLER